MGQVYPKKLDLMSFKLEKMNLDTFWNLCQSTLLKCRLALLIDSSNFLFLTRFGFFLDFSMLGIVFRLVLDLYS